MPAETVYADTRFAKPGFEHMLLVSILDEQTVDEFPRRRFLVSNSQSWILYQIWLRSPASPECWLALPLQVSTAAPPPDLEAASARLPDL